MDRISARADASKPSVYNHLESKAKLFQKLIRQRCGRFANSLDVRCEKGHDIPHQLTALGQADGRFMTSPGVMATTRMVMSEIPRCPQLLEEYSKKTGFNASFEGMLRDAVADGPLRLDDPRLAAEDFSPLIKGKAFWSVSFGASVVSPDEMSKIADSRVEMIVNRYGV